MDRNINYYNTLWLTNTATSKEIKASYYSLSKEYHPDKETGDENKFKEISEAYKVLSNIKLKEEYDTKSKFGANYSEINEIYDFEFSNDAKNYDKDKYNEFIKRDQLNVLVYIDDNFNGNVEYERWIYCKTCNGSGMDNNSKTIFKDENGNIKYLNMDDDCEFCDGTGKWKEFPCFYCKGAGKVNFNKCVSCLGEKRVKGKQRLNSIKMKLDDKDFKIEFMGNVSKDIPNKVGHLWLIRK